MSLTDMDDTVLGWTMKQMGAAKAHHYSVTKEALDTNLKSAVTLKMWWEKRRDDEPLGSSFVGIEPEIDFGWALKVFKNSEDEFKKMVFA